MVHRCKNSIISFIIVISLIISGASILPVELSWAADDATSGAAITGPAVTTPTGPAVKPAPPKPAKPVTKVPKKIKAVISKDKNKIKFSWSKVSNAKGYQIWYSTKKNFKKTSKKVVLKKVTVKGKDNRKYLIDSPYNKIRYYAKVRAYRMVKGKKIYSPFTATVKITTTNRKWIDVDLSKQKTYLMKGRTKVKTYTISSGKAVTPTVQGSFTIYMKRDHHDMKGYDIVKKKDYVQPDVRWISYFKGGYAFHGTYWHHNFGHPMSHGCVNMRTEDARYVYKWAPVGTLVVVHK
jgi:lipoprotein-anchoring transpeptidase ErfK/SrfK